MRSDWVSPSAATLVIGAFALVLGTLLNPAVDRDSAAETLMAVQRGDGRLLAMAMFYFVAALGLMLGLPAVLSVFARRGWRLGVAGVTVFAVGVLGTAGFSMLLVFFRALVLERLVTVGGVQDLMGDLGLMSFVYTWIAGFYGGLVLIAGALLLARATPVWVPVLLLAAVALFPFAQALGLLGGALQTLSLAVGFTGVAVTAVTGHHGRTPVVTSP